MVKLQPFVKLYSAKIIFRFIHKFLTLLKKICCTVCLRPCGSPPIYYVVGCSPNLVPLYIENKHKQFSLNHHIYSVYRILGQVVLFVKYLLICSLISTIYWSFTSTISMQRPGKTPLRIISGEFLDKMITFCE